MLLKTSYFWFKHKQIFD